MATLNIKDKDPWWVIVLKVIVYAIGLILAGMGTVEAANLTGLTAMLT